MQTFTGLRVTGVHSHSAVQPFTAASSSSKLAARSPFRVVAQKRVVKKEQVLLTKDSELGKAGQLKTVPVGYWRNFLKPQGLAVFASEGILEKIRAAKEAEERQRQEVKAKAQAMATALATIGKFVIRKKVGEKGAIFGSVTTADIVEAIQMQTGRELDKKSITLPEIKELGTYDATVKLHPEVTGSFKVVVQKDTKQH